MSVGRRRHRLRMTATGQFAAAAPGNDFTFVQISDSHIGFAQPANQDVIGTLNETVDKINALRSNRRSSCTRATSRTFPKRNSSTWRRAFSGASKRRHGHPREHDAIGADGAKRFAAAFPTRRTRRLVVVRPQRRALRRAGERLHLRDDGRARQQNSLDWLAKDLAKQKPTPRSSYSDDVPASTHSIRRGDGPRKTARRQLRCSNAFRP